MELVSCLMATRNRPAFVAQALRCFTRQTYAAAELLLLDDGEESVAALCEGVARVRYVRFDRPITTGAKLNRGVELARGSLLQKLDDDDWYHPDFLRVAVEHVPAEGRDSSLVAWDCFLMLLAGESGLRYSGHGWTIGNTLLFTRAFWAVAPFRDISRGVDSHFLRDRQGSLVRVCAPEHCIVVRHGRNTWFDMRSGEPVDDYFRRFPLYAKPLAEIVPPEDRRFCESLSSPAASRKA
jgi:glycosyltransferase involved in cell wall biosynthesis